MKTKDLIKLLESNGWKFKETMMFMKKTERGKVS